MMSFQKAEAEGAAEAVDVVAVGETSEAEVGVVEAEADFSSMSLFSAVCIQ